MKVDDEGSRQSRSQGYEAYVLGLPRHCNPHSTSVGLSGSTLREFAELEARSRSWHRGWDEAHRAKHATNELSARKAAWIAEFTNYVVRLRPDALPMLVAAVAADFQARLGHFDPIDVAEAEWEDMNLGDRTATAELPRFGPATA